MIHRGRAVVKRGVWDHMRASAPARGQRNGTFRKPPPQHHQFL